MSDQSLLYKIKETCPKCGNEDISTSYHADKEECSKILFATRSSKKGEHLHKYCRYCQYDWCELTIEEKDKAMVEDIRKTDLTEFKKFLNKGKS